jgi:hypothetical protein
VARKSKEPAEKKVQFSRLKAIWTDLTFGDWLLLVSDLCPEAGFTRSGPHIKGRCPFHDDPGPSFVITPGKGMVKCFGCHKSFYDPIKFVAALTAKSKGQSCSFGDALLFMRKRFGLKGSIPEALFEKVRDHEQYQRAKNTLCKFFCDELFEGIASYRKNPLDGSMEIDNNYRYVLPAVEYLISRSLGGYAPNEARPAHEADDEEVDAERKADPYGIWHVLTSNQLLGVLPPIAVVANKFGQDAEETKFFQSYFSAYTQDAKFLGFLVFPLHDEPDSVCRFKLRCPSREKKEMFFVDDAYEAEMKGFRGFYGLHYYRTMLGVQSVEGKSYADTACLVEGEFDALACIAQQVRRQSDEFIAFSLGGASVQSLDSLSNYGITRARILQDRDRGGDNIVQKCAERTTSDKITITVFNWPDEYKQWRDPANPDRRIEDPDEAISYVGYPRWARYVNTTDSYWHLHEWCFDQASKEISRVDADDVRQRNRVATEWGKLLRGAQECNTFCDVIEKHFGLDKSILFREIRAKDEDEESFIERTCDILKEHLHFIGIQHAEGRKRLLVIWVKALRQMDTIVLNDEKSIETVFARYFGTLYEFVRDKIGDPAFMSNEGEDSLFAITIRVKKYREYLNFALLKLAQGLPSMDNAPTKGQGLHYISSGDGEMHSYMVNGRDVFHLVHGDENRFETRLLDGPSDRGIIFDNNGEAWLHSVKKASQIEEADVDLTGLFLGIRDMLESGWSFKYQALDCTFLALYIMCLPVMTVFTRQTAIMFNAEHASGKSRITSGLIGGTGFPRINIVAHALAMQGYTAASIRQQRNNSSLTLCLEEFEDYGTNDAKSMTVRKVLELCRDLISESAVNWSIGTTSGESRTYHLRFPLVACAIRPLRDAASLSRFVSFELVKDDNRIDPVIALVDKFGDKGIKDTRHELAVGLLRHMPAIRRIQTTIEKEYSSNSMMPSHVSARFREALYPAMVMLRLIEEDCVRRHGKRNLAIPQCQQFGYDFAESRKDQLARLKTTSENEQVFESILSSGIQIINSDERVSGVTTIRVMLADINKLEDINKTKKGVYIDKQMEWLVVNWIEATQGVLANTKYKNETPTFLKQVSERSPFHVANDQVRQNKVLERLVDAMGPCQSLELISVFNVKHILESARKSRETAFIAPVTAIGGPALQSDIPETVDGMIV